MKRLFTLCAIVIAVAVSSCSKFDDSAIWDKLNEQEQTLNDHEKRIAALEELCKQMNTNINALQTIVEALEKKDYVTNVSPVREDGEIVGYTISFANSDTITIYNGKDGVDGTDGKDGYTPQIGVKKDADGLYYWTLDGEWLLDDNGNKIKAVGEDGRDGQNGTDGTNGSNGSNGQDGQDGEDGTDGRDGVDGITPRLKIENDYWYVSYDEGATWIELGRATGEDGADGSDGSDGEDGDSIFSSVTQDEEYVYFNLADGTMITLPKHDKENIQFEDLQVKAICCWNWDTNFDGELSYAEAAAVTDIGTVFMGNTDIIAFTELKYFAGLTKIPARAFNGCTALWKVVLPDNIVQIGREAFYSCKNITNITLHNGISRIEGNAFTDCSGLKNIIIPNSVEYIGTSAFSGCSNTNLISIGSGLIESESENAAQSIFRGCTGELVCLSNLVTYYDSENGGSYGALYNSKFDKVTLGGTYIDTHTFHCDLSGYHPTIKVLILEASIQSIQYGGIECKVLHTLYCKSTTPPSCNEYSFDCPALKKIYVPIGTLSDYKNASGWSKFASKIEEYDFENGIVAE